MKKLCLTISVIVLCSMGSVLSALAAFEGVSKTYPLPVEVEGEQISTKFYLSLKVYEFNQPSSVVFANSTGKGPESALKDIITSVKQNSSQAFADLSNPGENTGAIFEIYRTAFAGCSDPVIVRRFDIGALYYFLLDVNNPKFPVLPVLIIKKNEEQFLQSYKSIGHPVCQNVTVLSRVLLTLPDRFSPVTNPQYNAEICLLPLFGESEENPVFFRFTGSKVAYSLFSSAESAEDTYPANLEQPFQFYKNMSYALTADTTQKYAEYFGPKSKAKVSRFLDRMKSGDRNQFDAYLRLHMSYRQVSYVLFSDNLYILFYQSHPGDYKSGGLQYDMLFNYPNVGMKRVNFYFESNIDDFLKWEQFASRFITNVINAEE
jgi:hypothetical protein